MRYPASEKAEIIELVERSHLPAKRTLDKLDGYAGAKPVRIGNASASYEQHDVWGAILDAAYIHTRTRDKLPERVWPMVKRQVELAAENWATRTARVLVPSTSTPETSNSCASRLPRVVPSSWPLSHTVAAESTPSKRSTAFGRNSGPAGKVSTWSPMGFASGTWGGSTANGNCTFV